MASVRTLLIGTDHVWNKIKSIHPREFECFHRMIKNSKSHGVDCDFVPAKPTSFYNLLEIVGPIPENMEKPVIARIDTNFGFGLDKVNNRWNIKWKEQKETMKANKGKKFHQLRKPSGEFIRSKMAP